MSTARRLRLTAAIALFALGVALVACSEKTDQGAVHVLRPSGSVGPIMERYLDRGIDRAESNDAKLVVIELDTPGGLSSSMRDIVQRIEASDVPVAVYVWPMGGRAASAGTFITMSGHIAAMAPNTSIGAASAVNADGSDIEETLSRKIEEDDVAFIRGIALLRERNADWAEQAVREAVAVNQQEAVELDVVDFVATDLADLLRQSEGRTIEVQPGQNVTLTGLPEAPIVRTNMTVWERFLDVIADPSVASILISIGFFALLAEIINPGMVVPGVAGVIAMLLGFLGFGVLPVDTTGLILIALGLGLLALEVFLPGGILGIGGIVALVLGGIIAFRHTPGDLRPPTVLVVVLAVLLGAIFLSTGMAVARVRKLTAKTGTEALIGKTAVARTPLSPEGYVFVQGERWRAELDRGTAQEGVKVRIVGADGLKLRVEQLAEEG
jgi:membrane-bound serine protease (ClpP class)